MLLPGLVGDGGRLATACGLAPGLASLAGAISHLLRLFPWRMCRPHVWFLVGMTRGIGAWLPVGPR